MNHYKWLTLVALALVSPVQAKDVYKARAADGSVIFSDKPIPGGQIIHIKDIPTVSLPKAHKGGTITYPLKTTGVQGNIARYEKLSITTPENDSTLENQSGEAMVILALKPGLQSGHKYRLVLDGKPIDPPTQKSAFRLNNLDRGDHTLQGQVVDKDGLPVIASEVVTIHVHRPSIGQKSGEEPATEATPPVPEAPKSPADEPAPTQ
ncbi:MAG TPA: hypothetical protein VFM46_00495 [Pseudomonadales bacterium]|nr:hypothetical protein [Pseudomonadales bacterium]